MADHSRPPVPSWLTSSAAVGWRLLVLAAVVWVVAVLATKLTLVVVTVTVALLLAAVLAPAVDRVRGSAWGRRAPDWAAPLAAVLLVLVVVLAGAVALGARVADQLPQLRDQLGQATSQLTDRLGVELPLPGPLGGDGASGGQGSGGQSSGGGSGGASGGGGGGEAAQQAASVLSGAAEVLFGFFLVLAFAFLALKDGRDMWAWLLSRLGADIREGVDVAGRAAWSTLGTYVRGLTVVALFDAVGIGVGLLLLGVPLALTLAGLQFVASYVPTVGAFVAGAVAVAVAFVDGGAVTALLVLALVVVVQQVGNDVIEPWIMGRTLGLHPAVVLVAVTAGGVLWGIAGALLFVPLAAAASAVGHALWQRRAGSAAAPG